MHFTCDALNLYIYMLVCLFFDFYIRLTSVIYLYIPTYIYVNPFVGRLADALTEISGINGYERVQLRDWEAEARTRLFLNQTVRMCRASAILIHKKNA